MLKSLRCLVPRHDKKGERHPSFFCHPEARGISGCYTQWFTLVLKTSILKSLRCLVPRHDKKGGASSSLFSVILSFFVIPRHEGSQSATLSGSLFVIPRHEGS